MNPAFPTRSPADKLRTNPALHLRSWGDEFVAYHALSGDTHLLDAQTGRLLQTLQQTPADIQTLHTLLNTTDAEAFHALLAQLEAIFLIERTPS